MVSILTGSLLFLWGRVHDEPPNVRGGLFFGRFDGVDELFRVAHRHFFLSLAMQTTTTTASRRCVNWL
ncbi:hypothetical protein LF599_07425 [Pseudodesulfovibrio thermohalotolerans]|uniref:hypothetical protein n=1 Tax=Pseudodesulfovibrio thermohalotolerans TaxID=2880651 RepID=UPI0024413658|nr:hypothetical protein [Pseudodesulfovibrio thermohalotolerans]WFS63985.1 hypothetical protein LF599_07425 [Pseudodesulfovibrio thermohalotolerans]